MQKLGRNQGRYQGETVRTADVLARVRLGARRHGWSLETVFEAADRPILACRRNAAAASSPAGAGPLRLYLSAGIHGDEPAGPLAALRLLEQNLLPPDSEIWLLPVLNPSGLDRGQRENAEGSDLNRDYRQPHTGEVRAHVAWLARQPRFDLALCLHEDWEANGFYVYELNPHGGPPLAERIIRAVAPVCPTEYAAVIDGREAAAGIIRPQINLESRPDWPEAFHLIARNTGHSCTLEAPSDFPLETRVEALCRGVMAAVGGG